MMRKYNEEEENLFEIVLFYLFGILMVETWLKSATESAIVNTPLSPRIYVDGRSGLAEHQQ